MEEALTFTDPAGHKVAGILATSEEKTDRIAVLCHGFLSNKNSKTNQALTALLPPQGIGTFRFDFFGQGESEGPFEQITVSLAVWQALAGFDLMSFKGYRNLALVGSSFGGLVALLAAAQRPRIACMALKCPVPDFPEMLNLEFGGARFGPGKATRARPHPGPRGTAATK